jgi:transposase-like protein
VLKVQQKGLRTMVMLTGDEDCLPAMVEAIVQATLEAEMTEALGAEKGERTPARLGYRSGYYACAHQGGTLEGPPTTSD